MSRTLKAASAALVVVAASATVAGATGTGSSPVPVPKGPPPATGTAAPALAPAKPVHASYVGAALVGPRGYCDTRRARHGDKDGQACVLAAKRNWTYFRRAPGNARHGGDSDLTTAPVTQGGAIGNSYNAILWVKPYAKGWHWAWNPTLGNVILPTRALSYYGVKP